MNPELDARLSALLDDELPPEEAARLREEIARRPELAARLAELAAVDAGLRTLPERPVPGDLRARLDTRIQAERAGWTARRAPPRRVRWLPAAALAAAAAAVLALVVLPRLRPERDVTVARRETTPQPEAAPTVAPEPAPDLEDLALELVEPSAPSWDEPTAPSLDDLADEDLPVIAVLDVLAELDALEAPEALDAPERAG